jgi:predicted nucleic acid-binding protein
VSVYFDTAYVAKCYLNEPDSVRVRAVLRTAGGGHSSSLCLAEFAATLLRHARDGSLTGRQILKLKADFGADVESGVWSIVPVSDAFMERVATRIVHVSPTTFVRAGDAIHLQAAVESGFADVWTNDRHMLAAAPAFGLQGKSV